MDIFAVFRQRSGGRFAHFPVGLTVLLALALSAPAHAGLVGYYSAGNFTLTNTGADGWVVADLSSLTLTGGNDGSGFAGVTDLVISAAGTGQVRFDYLYTSADIDPLADSAGYLVGGVFTRFLTPSGTVSFDVNLGQIFGFRVETVDNIGEPGVLNVSAFSAPQSSVPEPGTSAVLAGLAALVAARYRRFRVSRELKRTAAVVAVVLMCSGGLFAQGQSFFQATEITGQLTRTAVVNAGQLASQVGLASVGHAGSEIKKNAVRTIHPPFSQRLTALATPTVPSLAVSSTTTATGFTGLTHFDQRNANNGNQFSVEPPSQSLAANNQYVLEGVNNAIQVYSPAGAPLLARVISTNQLFGVSPAIDRGHNDINGVYPTDMKVFYDQGINRWIVLQRAQDYDIFGNALSSSHLYIAVSQTGDPTGSYSVYTMNTTNSGHIGCPCFTDYPQIGADQYGIYISTNQYDTGLFPRFIDARIFAISKASLSANAVTPTLMDITIPGLNGYEFTIFPASTPPGASYFLASGGLEYFVSTQFRFASDNRFALWALTNTASLNNAHPSLTMIQTTVNAPDYSFPDVATQKPGFLTYGSTLFPAGQLAYIDGGDCRVQSVVYAGGRLYVTLATQVIDDTGHFVVGSAYSILSPTYRNGTLAATPLRQGYLAVRNNHLLRPALAVNPQGKGALVVTLVGPDYYPSAAFLPLDLQATGTTLQIASPGAGPEDGFTGYPDLGYPSTGVARWGDSSAAVVAPDGAIWMTTEFIPNAARTELANWGTFLMRFRP